jgi:tetratricopeptide (TPR) repeat protein
MNKPFSNPLIFLTCLTACYIVVGIWTPLHAKTKEMREISTVLSEISREMDGTPTGQNIKRWTEAVKQRPTDDNAWVNLGNALMQKARETTDVHYYNYAESVFREAFALDQHNVSAMIGIAWVYNSRHEFGQGIEWAKRVIAINPASQDAYALLGDAAIEIGNYEEAFEHYQKMLDIRPDLSSYSRAAHLLYLTGDSRKAIWMMEKAISAGSPYTENIAWCRAQLALMLWNTGALLPAEKILNRALEQAPNNFHVLMAMGVITASRKDYDAALEYYKKAIAITPHHDALVSLGDLYMINGNNKKAEEQYARVEAMHKSHEDNHSHDKHSIHNQHNGHGNIQLARFYADHDRNLHYALHEAEAAYRTYKNVFTMDTLAWCYYKNGNYEDAKKIIKKVLKIGTPDANILFHAGMIYAKLGKPETAQKYLYQALSLNPNFHPIYSNVAADILKKLHTNKQSG